MWNMPWYLKMKEEEKWHLLLSTDISLKLAKRAKASLPAWLWEKWSMCTDLIHRPHRDAPFCNVPLQLQTACLASTPWDTARSPSFTELKQFLERAWGTTRKLDHRREEHYSGWFAALKASYDVLHNLTLSGYFQGLPVVHTHVIQPQGYKQHHLLRSVKAVL